MEPLLTPGLVFTLVGLLFVAVGVVFVVSGVRGRAAARRLHETGHRSPARVLQVRSRMSGGRRSRRLLYFPVVQFQLPDGRVVRAETTHGASPAPAREGQTVEVLYDPARPERVTLSQGLAGPGTVSTMHIVLGAAVALMGAGATALGIAIVLLLR